MKYGLPLLVGLFLGLTLNMGYADTTDNTSVISNPSKNIVVSKDNAEFTLTLASNPTTGYSWHLVKLDRKLITLVNHEYQAPEQNRPGAGGKEVWTFKVKENGFIAPQIGKITLLYARPWNLKDNSKQLEFTVVTK